MVIDGKTAATARGVDKRMNVRVVVQQDRPVQRGTGQRPVIGVGGRPVIGGRLAHRKGGPGGRQVDGGDRGRAAHHDIQGGRGFRAERVRHRQAHRERRDARGGIGMKRIGRRGGGAIPKLPQIGQRAPFRVGGAGAGEADLERRIAVGGRGRGGGKRREIRPAATRVPNAGDFPRREHHVIQQPVRAQFDRHGPPIGIPNVRGEIHHTLQIAAAIKHQPLHPPRGVIRKEEVARIGRRILRAGKKRAADHGTPHRAIIGVEGKRHDPRRDRLTLGGKGGLIPRLLRVALPAGPPIIRPGRPFVDFLPGVPPDIADKRQVRGRMQAQPKGIPQPIGPDLGPNAIAPVIKRIHGQRRLGRTCHRV